MSWRNFESIILLWPLPLCSTVSNGGIEVGMCKQVFTCQQILRGINWLVTCNTSESHQFEGSVFWCHLCLMWVLSLACIVFTQRIYLWSSGALLVLPIFTSCSCKGISVYIMWFPKIFSSCTFAGFHPWCHSFGS